MNFKISLGSSSKGRPDKEKKRGNRNAKIWNMKRPF